jgi:hypothetical protein
VPAALPRLNSVPPVALDLWDLLRREPRTEAALHRRYAADFQAYGYRRFDPASPEACAPARAAQATGEPAAGA